MKCVPVLDVYFVYASVNKLYKAGKSYEVHEIMKKYKFSYIHSKRTVEFLQLLRKKQLRKFYQEICNL